jgi:hypothetical protein
MRELTCVCLSAWYIRCAGDGFARGEVFTA